MPFKIQYFERHQLLTGEERFCTSPRVTPAFFVPAPHNSSTVYEYRSTCFSQRYGRFSQKTQSFLQPQRIFLNNPPFTHYALSKETKTKRHIYHIYISFQKNKSWNDSSMWHHKGSIYCQVCYNIALLVCPFPSSRALPRPGNSEQSILAGGYKQRAK